MVCVHCEMFRARSPLISDIVRCVVRAWHAELPSFSLFENTSGDVAGLIELSVVVVDKIASTSFKCSPKSLSS